MRSPNRRFGVTAALVTAAMAVGAVGCSSSGNNATTGGSGGGTASGKILISGSSTVKPISQRVAELFEDKNSAVSTTVDGPGTGDGFKLFCKGETDIADASRPIKKEEADDCAKNGVEFVELKVGIDGLAVLTSPANTGVTCLTPNDLYAVMGGESEGFKKWSDAQALAAELGSKTTLPDASLDITAPGTESGTYDSFYELALQKIAEKRATDGKAPKDDKGKPKIKVRKDYSSQANDNAIISGIEGSKSSFGWVGFAYAKEAGDKVKFIEIDGGKGCVKPTETTIADGTYPLSRKLYIYVSKKKLDANPAIGEYVDFYLSDEGIKAVTEVDYIALDKAELDKSRQVWKDRTLGTRDGGK